MFIHLHNHSHFSILEGLPQPADYVKKAKEYGMKAVALTDSGNIHGCHEFYKECKKAGIKPILGTEILVSSPIQEKINHKLVLLAKNMQGYRNIISLISKASLENPGNIPHITFQMLQEMADNYSQSGKTMEIVCLSGPISGEISYMILSGKSDEEILGRIAEYQAIFGKENYFLELLYHDDIAKQNFVTDILIELNKKYHIPVVVTNNCYYIEKEDKKTQDIIMALGTGHEIENPDRQTLINGNYSFLSEEEMQVLFGFLPEALENTVKIADMIDIHIETGGILIPQYTLPEEDQAIYEHALKEDKKFENIKVLGSGEWYLRYLSFKGMNTRFGYHFSQQEILELIRKCDVIGLEKNLQDTSPEELKILALTYYTDNKKKFLSTLTPKQQLYIERLEYELLVIHKMGFDGYFLIVADYINWARTHEVPVGPGRGSAAGSLMAYLSGITDLDPIAYDLLFERFLNPARVSMPDIDTDFSDEGRDRVVEYCRQKYGYDRVAQICTFGTFAARAAVKDVGRVMGVPFAQMNELAKLIPEKPGTKLAEALEDSLEFKEAYDKTPLYKDIIDNALKIEGNVRQIGVHACAVIIAPEPMTNFTALQYPPKDSSSIITQYSAYPLEDLGLLKMDFLGLKNLTIIKNAQAIIKTTHGVALDMLSLNMEDIKVFEVFAQGDTTGIFQFESEGMRKYLIDLKPNTFEDIIVMVSLYRPGPLQYIPTYIDRKHGREALIFPHPSLEEILATTQGIAVYQEQIMKMVQVFAGFSLGEADILRRAIGKKKVDVLLAQKQIFIEAATKLGHSEELAKHIFENVIEPFAGYGFNRSHAACYAFIAYQTAFLKAYYPSEFLTALMMSDEENMERIVLEVIEAQSKGIEVLPSNVNSSLKHFTYIDATHIRFGIKAIKGIGDGPIDKIVQARQEAGGKFENIEHFIEMCGKEVINKKSLEALILAGAMDDLGKRKTLFEGIPEMIRFSRKDEKQKKTNQIGLFDNSDVFEDKLELKETPDFSFEEKLAGEKSVIGFYISGHPLDGLGRYCSMRSHNIQKLKMSMESLLEQDKKSNPEKYLPKTQESASEKEVQKPREVPKDEIIQAVGVIVDMRKNITKAGKTMMFLKCEGFDYDFEVVIFPKDVEKYVQKLEIAKIIIINGSLDINFEYNRRSIRARDIKIATINQAREQAIDMGVFNTQKRYGYYALHTPIPEKKNEESDDLENSLPKAEETEAFEDNLDEKIIENMSENDEPEPQSFIISVPSFAKKQDLQDLKEFLESQIFGDIHIFLDLKGQSIDTKIKLHSVEKLEEWRAGRWDVR